MFPIYKLLLPILNIDVIIIGSFEFLFWHFIMLSLDLSRGMHPCKNIFDGGGD